tara:strand:+ start:54 stop:452 length:399 start_codon:yes stop_codon:yes gene_type:complete
MTEWIEGVLKHSETELKLLGLDQTSIGPAIITFIRELHGVLGNQPGLIKTLTKQVGDLVDQKPLAPITEKDFVDDRCTRYPYIYKSGEKYYNDRAVVFKKGSDTQYIYQGQYHSKQEITLPYVLLEEIVLIP